RGVASRRLGIALLLGLGVLAVALVIAAVAGVIPSLRATAESPAPVVLAAGDIGNCASDGDEATAALLDQHQGLVLTLGDTAYDSGTPEEIARCFAPAWGRHKSR